MQRDYVLERAAEAKNDLVNNVDWPERSDCCVGDYYQNLGMPHFGGEQLGDTYYFSPLTVNIFDVCDYAMELLNTYVYIQKLKVKREAMMLYHWYIRFCHQKVLSMMLKGMDLEKTDSCFDNYGGQNKKHMVVRYIIWWRLKFIKQLKLYF